MGAGHAIQGMYSNAGGHVRVSDQYNEEFSMGIGVHQGYILSPLLFILVLGALLCEFRIVVPWELLYADDLVLIWDTQEFKVKKAGMECKRLRVNLKKDLVSYVGHNVLRNPSKTPSSTVLSAVVVLAATQPSACIASCRSTKGAVASLEIWWLEISTQVPMSVMMTWQL